MGFNKRVLNRENIERLYNEYGYQAVYDYITKPDALYYNSCGDIVDIITGDECCTVKKLKLEVKING